MSVFVIPKMKKKFTLPNILFGIFAVIVIGLGVRKYLQNQEEIAKWDLEQAERLREADRILNELEENASRRRFDPTF